MTRVNVFLRSVLLAIIVALASVAPSAAGLGPPAGVPGPPSSTPGQPDGLPSPVCTPSWGSVVLPFCI
jgi:hypothetical protein